MLFALYFTITGAFDTLHLYVTIGKRIHKRNYIIVVCEDCHKLSMAQDFFFYPFTFDLSEKFLQKFSFKSKIFYGYTIMDIQCM